MNLYKYRDFSNPTETDFRRLETLLQQGVFWCARPDTLNDPEEFSWTCKYTASAHTQELLTDLLVQVNGRTREIAQEKSITAISNGHLAILAKPIIEGIIQQCRNDLGLVCLGTSPDNLCLWQRYGGGGAGICIEIKAPDTLIDDQFFRVQYFQEKLIHIDQLMRAFLDPNHTREIYTLALLSKPISWASEEEIRFVSKSQNVLVTIDGAKITRIMLGEELAPENRKRIEKILASL